MRNEWYVSFGDFAMTWKEPLSEDDVHDIEQLTDLAIRGIRRRLECAPVVNTDTPDLTGPGDSLEKQTLSGAASKTE